LTKRRAPNIIEWCEKQERAFTQIKNQTGLVKRAQSIFKLTDLDRPFVVQTDALNKTLVACLLV